MQDKRTSPRARRLVVRSLATASVAACVAVLTPAAGAGATETPRPYSETYRPQFHFSPAQNWMNDPNGPIWYKGRYHLFFQYNPSGNTWGNMSWGHATSPDLVHWTQQPLAIPQDDTEMVFSGAVVFDKTNSSGLGTHGNPPLVAVYTSLHKSDSVQAQALAYSTDGGTTWKKYAGNPVIDIGSRDFRDPKVFWNAKTRSWTMAVALSAEHKVRFYSSPDLKHWTELSEFGPAGATGGAWECPDLFPLAVDGDPSRVKWVLVVNINPGGPQGASAAQYFVGDFDGKTFTPDDSSTYTPPAGEVIADFEDGTYRSWTTTGTAFGSAPAAGTLPGQQLVTGYQGSGLANSFIDFDASTGSLTSPEFTIDKPYLNFLIGGGNHPISQPDPTAVNLVVNGKVVRTTTGQDGEALDWTHWNVADLAGQKAQIQIVDDNTSGWGHINADQFVLADAPALGSVQRAHWMDYGADFYAATSVNDEPRGRRVVIGWMNSWQYGQDIPTSPWRSADTFPRELALRTVHGKPQLVQQPVQELNILRTGITRTATTILPDGTDVPLAANGSLLDITATLRAGTAKDFGIKVHTGAGQETRIGYDTATQEIYVDRTRSGASSFSPAFAGVQRAPLTLDSKGRLDLRIVVDTSSVEVYADDGRVVLTDQIFPDPSSNGVSAYAEGGTAHLDSLRAQRLRSAWR